MPSPSPLDTSRRGSSTELNMKSDHPDRRPSMIANTSSPIVSPNVSMGPEEAPIQPQGTTPDEQKYSSRLQLAWNDAISKNMNLPEGYAQVAVLVIKWAEHLDDLNTGDEVAQLEALFQNEFRYETEIVSLGEKAPRHQLCGYVATFLEKYDGPNNLLIVYYTGHSRWNVDTNALELYANSDVPHVVQWKHAHNLLLEGVSADTLAILDTCYASNATKGGLHSGRTYQLLAASGWNKLTAGPGIRSFTAALIESLEECLQIRTPFTVWGLMSKINKKRYRRNNPAQLHDLLGSHSRQILLAPLGKNKKERAQTEQKLIERSGIADLVLRFSLGVEDLSQTHIEELTKRLPRVFQDMKLDLRRIELDGLKRNLQQKPMLEAPAMTIHHARRFLRQVRKSIGAANRDDHVLPDSDDVDPVTESSTHMFIPASEATNVVVKRSIPKKMINHKPEISSVANDTHYLLIGLTALSTVHVVAHLFLSWRRS